MKGKRLDPTSSLHDTQGNRGREQKIDYVDDPIYSSLEKFMAFYYAKYGDTPRKAAHSQGVRHE